MKVLFIAYYFDPYPGVGAKRISYWARNLHVRYPGIRCDVVTAVDPGGTAFPTIDRVHHVPDSGRCGFDRLPGSRSGVFGRQIRNKTGFTWCRDLERFMKGHDESYGACVVTGGPFMHFGIAPLVRRKFRCGVALDFRDPFANHPVARMAGWKLAATRFLERRFIRGADAAIVVNEYCRDLLCDRSVPSFVIDNGYDEEVLDRLPKEPRRPGPIRIGYAGKMLAHRSPFPFLDVLREEAYRDRFVFTHVGEPEPRIQARAAELPNVVQTGPLAYEDALRRMAGQDVAILFTRGDAFESTTKIFDYVGLEKPILIVTDGKPRTGGLHDATADYPAVVWCRNDPEDIRRTLDGLRTADLSVQYPDRTRFSRKHGLERLVEQVLPVLLAAGGRMRRSTAP